MSMQDVIRHYDLLIDEGNDPARDPAALQAYMDLWDGETFLHALGLNGNQSVLEVGVGTGRIALRAAPRCCRYVGIDLSPKTIARAKENLAHLSNVTLLCGDFLTVNINDIFDVVYSSLTFMHIKDKRIAIKQIVDLLAPGGRAVISLDKSRDEYIDYGTRSVRVYPDDPQEIAALFAAFGMSVLPMVETEFAYIIVAERA